MQINRKTYILEADYRYIHKCVAHTNSKVISQPDPDRSPQVLLGGGSPATAKAIPFGHVARGLLARPNTQRLPLLAIIAELTLRCFYPGYVHKAIRQIEHLVAVESAQQDQLFQSYC